MKPRLLVYISVVILLGFTVGLVDVVWLIRELKSGHPPLLDGAIWLGLILLVSHFHIVSRSGTAVSTLNSALNYAMIISFGPAFAGPAVALNGLYLNLIRHRAVWYKALFNSAQLLLAVNIAGGLYMVSGGQVHTAPDFHNWLSYVRLLVPFLGFSLVNLLTVSVAVRLDRGTPIRQQVKASHYYDVGGNTILFYLGAQLATLYLTMGWLGTALATIPLVWVYTYLKRYNELKITHEQLDQSNQTLREQSVQLRQGNLELERLNRDLAEQSDTLRVQAVDLEDANRTLQQVNEDLQHTRRTLLQAEKLKAMGQMAGGVAHDFNNILGAIIARTELLKLEPLGGRLAEGLRSIHKSALDGAEVVRRIQDFTRVTERRDFEPVDLAELVEDVLDMTRAIWRDKAQRLGITYHIQRRCQPSLWVMGNASELREVLHNLIINALDAMPSGGDLVLEGAIQDDKVRLKVRDLGHGMTPEVLERIFDPFFTTKGARGNGLGLSVSYGIVERHAGELGASSTPGMGSEFTLVLPSAREEQLKAALPRVEAFELPRALTSRTVLVVDDEPDVRGVLVDALRMMGHDVDEAASGQEGLDLWQAKRHSHVFTDLGMPGINGWELADRIRSQQDSTSSPPVLILVTGWGAQIREEDRLAHLVDHVLPKPFKIRDLARLVQDAESSPPTA